MKKIGPLEWDNELCKFCNLCVQMCPQKCLQFKGKELVIESSCLKCGICTKYCPEMGLQLAKDSEDRKEQKQDTEENKK
ncbi:hypothetical protein GF371_00515 [Candidatus Woesearchaeota archaeon]|nr:hypothetical protein [Candidatus Woesearchaeota archaeon]